MSLNLSTLSFLSNLGKQPDSIKEDLRLVLKGLQNVAEGFPKPFVFLKSQPAGVSTNQSADVLLVLGTPVPRGHKGQVEDFNVNFVTVAGTVQLVIYDSSNNIIARVLRNISSDTSGIGKTILDEGQHLALVGQTAGAGVASVYCSGTIVRLNI